MIDLGAVELDEIATALADQSLEHRWLIDPATGAISVWSEEGDERADLDELDLVAIRELPSWVWYRDRNRTCRSYPAR